MLQSPQRSAFTFPMVWPNTRGSGCNSPSHGIVIPLFWVWFHKLWHSASMTEGLGLIVGLISYLTDVHFIQGDQASQSAQDYPGSGLPWWLSGKESTCNEGDSGSIPGSGNPLEKGMATHSSILPWRIPWMEADGKESACNAADLGLIRG